MLRKSGFMEKSEPGSWKSRLHQIYTRLNRLSGGSLGIIRRAFQRFGKNRGPEAAASIAFFALFSLFPLVLFLIAGASFVFLDRPSVQQRLFTYLSQAVPISTSVIVKNIQQVLDKRNAFGLVAVVSLLWSSSGAFNLLTININRAWTESKARDPIHRRLIAISMVALLVVLLLLSLIATTVLNLLPKVNIPGLGEVDLFNTVPWKLFSNLLPFLIRLLAFWLIYRLVPTTAVNGLAALVGALVGALGWEVITAGFTFYLSSGLANYELVYGSLGTIVALMFWIYLSSYIILFSAYLSASVQQGRE
jgi:membrane protein